MRAYVTLFDSNYLSRGLVMYRSLLRHGGDFHLWIICFDDLAYSFLNQLKLAKVTLVSLAQFEDVELLKIKPTRTRQEYCWTCTPSVILYVLKTEQAVSDATYLDADLMFFSSPEVIFGENPAASIYLTEHRYAAINHTKTSGIYNVQFAMFKKDESGLKALEWWRERCLEWCYARYEDNKFGDQKYLDDWPSRFQGVHVIENLGAGLAPWNAINYSYHKTGTEIRVENYPLVFYHFHALKLHKFKIGYSCETYPIPKEVRKWVYKPYFNAIGQAYQTIDEYGGPTKAGLTGLPQPPKHKSKLRFLARSGRDIWQGRYFRYS